MTDSKIERLSMAFRAIEAVVVQDIRHGFPSCQIAVRLKDQLLYENAWGVRNILCNHSENNSVGPLTLYDLASNTKMYTVNYALQYLHSWKKLDLDRKIWEILGPAFYDAVLPISYEGYKETDPATQKSWKKSLTIRQILTHRGGFPADPRYFMRNFDFSRQMIDPSAENPFFISLSGKESKKIRLETLEALFRTPLMYEPGTQTLYSDADYMLLCFVVEKLTGMDLESFLSETFWKPMGLKSLCFNPYQRSADFSQGIAATELHGNTRDGVISFDGIRTQTLQGQVHDEKAWYLMGGISGHAGLFAHAADLSALASLMLDGKWKGKTFFLPETLKSFTAPVSSELDHWGLGWWRQGQEKKRSYYFSREASPGSIGHQGWTGTLTLIDPEEQLVMAILTNKIHSPVTNPLSDPNTFEGEDYVTSMLGFAPRFVYACLHSRDEKEAYQRILSVWDELVEGRKKNRKESHPSSLLAYEAILRARENYQEMQTNETETVQIWKIEKLADASHRRFYEFF